MAITATVIAVTVHAGVHVVFDFPALLSTMIKQSNRQVGKRPYFGSKVTRYMSGQRLPVRKNSLSLSGI